MTSSMSVEYQKTVETLDSFAQTSKISFFVEKIIYFVHQESNPLL